MTMILFIISVILLAVSKAWKPEDEHPCTVRTMSMDDFSEAFPHGLPPLYPEPLVLRGNERNRGFREKCSRQRVASNFPDDFNVTLSSSNALSEHRRTIPFQQYLDESYQQYETTITQKANESWYLFGETYSEEWQHFYRDYELPLCQTCQPELCALSFGIGNRGSGVQWHTHGPGFSEALVGRKHWLLYPPDQKPSSIHKDQSSRQWMQDVYDHLSISDRPLECTLPPGDLIYFPDEWWHATINLDPYTVFISTFTTEHGIHTDEL